MTSSCAAIQSAQAQFDRDKIEFERMDNLVKENVTTKPISTTQPASSPSKARLSESQHAWSGLKSSLPFSGILNTCVEEENMSRSEINLQSL